VRSRHLYLSRGANGDTAAVLGLSSDEFEAVWYAFVRERYLS